LTTLEHTHCRHKLIRPLNSIVCDAPRFAGVAQKRPGKWRNKSRAGAENSGYTHIHSLRHKQVVQVRSASFLAPSPQRWKAFTAAIPSLSFSHPWLCIRRATLDPLSLHTQNTRGPITNRWPRIPSALHEKFIKHLPALFFNIVKSISWCYSGVIKSALYEDSRCSPFYSPVS